MGTVKWGVALAAMEGCREGGARVLMVKAIKAEGVKTGQGARVVKGPLAHGALDQLIG